MRVRSCCILATHLLDMIDYIRERLPKQYSRSQIIKQLRYEGIEYAPNTNARGFYRSHKAWSDILVTELRSLAEQYGELSEKPSCGLVDYIRTRLTEKRTRRDIEAMLVEINYDPGKIRTSKSEVSKQKNVFCHEESSLLRAGSQFCFMIHQTVYEAKWEASQYEAEG
uniref:Uncharacterized protein n=1 Tax=Parascaris equorum TaxID=6256 RepID=A0A914RUG9_PAREQ